MKPCLRCDKPTDERAPMGYPLCPPCRAIFEVVWLIQELAATPKDERTHSSGHAHKFRSSVGAAAPEV